eukprot:3313958-Rhodomonas_salina.1
MAHLSSRRQLGRERYSLDSSRITTCPATPVSCVSQPTSPLRGLRAKDLGPVYGGGGLGVE